ncbi:MAG: class I SAM-dependent methyltransferase [Cruoricaptor ignavus]|nr:class I SAM-dependent methyltransferase [Cruoricaptor ignavus]
MTDLPGKAIYDYFFKKNKDKLFVHDTFGPKVEMPINVYFRGITQMPELERIALNLASGKILDIGAGAGSHALELQIKHEEVTALEISPSACEVMKKRGVKNVICEDIFNFNQEKYDTLLLLMNGIGLCGTIDGLKLFLKKAETLLEDGGKLIFDSCDISYMYEDIGFPENYYGEAQCRYEYQNTFTEWFRWLYIDMETLQEVAKEMNWDAEIVHEDDQNQYLCVLTKIG